MTVSGPPEIPMFHNAMARSYNCCNMRTLGSLRRKITLGYFAAAVLIVGLSLVSLLELGYIEKKVQAGARISEFFDATLEIRRFEKNLFLYRQTADLEENLGYVSRAQSLLAENLKEFAVLAPPDRLSALEENLKTYRRQMEEYGRIKRPDSARAEAQGQKIRATGKEIVTLADEIARAERGAIRSALDRHRKILIGSIAALALLVVLIGRALSTMVARPLMSIETSMEAVASGKLDKIDIGGSDREIASLTAAFNHVLEELDRRQRHLVRSEKLAALGTLLSGVAHELNNPLSNISSSCQILMEEIEEGDLPAKKELLAQIDDQTNRARNIVRSLLDFARDKEFRREPLSLARLLDDTLAFIRGQIPTRVSVASDIPAEITVLGDRQRLQQAFLNLLANAAGAIEGTGRITIRAGKPAFPEGGAWLKVLGRFDPAIEAVDIEINDTGSGIPPEVLPRIFDPFFTTKDVGRGSGLGLFIVHEIVEEHDGSIAVRSEAGKGTTFLIRLPVRSGQPRGAGP